MLIVVRCFFKIKLWVNIWGHLSSLLVTMVNAFVVVLISRSCLYCVVSLVLISLFEIQLRSWILSISIRIWFSKNNCWRCRGGRFLLAYKLSSLTYVWWWSWFFKEGWIYWLSYVSKLYLIRIYRVVNPTTMD